MERALWQTTPGGRGLRRALILHGSDQRSAASASAAATAWAHQGGNHYGEQQKIPKGVDDYSTTLAKLLGLADSARRGEMLQALLGK